MIFAGIFRIVMIIIVAAIVWAISQSMAASNPAYAELRAPVFWISTVFYLFTQIKANSALGGKQ